MTEGTGLGLLYAHNIFEAYGGEAFVPGYKDGTPLSPIFSTAQGYYPSLLFSGFYTEFVSGPSTTASAFKNGRCVITYRPSKKGNNEEGTEGLYAIH